MELEYRILHTGDLEFNGYVPEHKIKYVGMAYIISPLSNPTIIITKEVGLDAAKQILEMTERYIHETRLVATLHEHKE